MQLEPTDWVGGQATASGVPAIDFAWHTVRALSVPRRMASRRTLTLYRAHRPPAAQVTDDNRTEDVWAIDRDPANITPTFRGLLALVGDPGACWVSNYCFPPAAFVQGANAMIAKLPTLTVYRDTVVKSVATASDGQGGLKIVSLTAIQRTPQPNVTCNGYDRFLSQVRSDALVS